MSETLAFSDTSSDIYILYIYIYIYIYIYNHTVNDTVVAVNNHSVSSVSTWAVTEIAVSAPICQ